MSGTVAERVSEAVRRESIGAVLGPLAFVALYLGNPFDVPAAANAAMAGTVWIVIWWVTEPVHIAVTSLVPIPVFSLTGVTTVESVTAQYAHPIVFLLLGGFMLALAVERCGLHRRIAVLFVARIGNAPERLLLGIMLVSGSLSMWISNTATSMLLLPIAVAIAAAGTGTSRASPDGQGESSSGQAIPDETPSDGDHATLDVEHENVDVGGFGIALLLGVAYGASIGGAATLIGSTPSAIFAGIASSQLGVSVGFVDWMLYAVPIVAVALVVAWVVILRLTDPAATIDETVVDEYRASLPAVRSDERRVTIVFGLVIVAWLARPFLLEPLLPALTDEVIAVLGGIALFLVPAGTDRDGDGSRLLSWDDTAELPWDVIILIGGSFAVAHAFEEGGLDQVVAESISVLGWLSLPVLVVLVSAAVMSVSNLMSNTAAVTVFLPILVAFAPIATVPSIDLMAPTALAASFVFVLPVSTPPNAIVYGSGHVDLAEMVRVGIVLNLICVPLVAVLSYVWLPLIQPFG